MGKRNGYVVGLVVVIVAAVVLVGRPQSPPLARWLAVGALVTLAAAMASRSLLRDGRRADQHAGRHRARRMTVETLMTLLAVVQVLIAGTSLVQDFMANRRTDPAVARAEPGVTIVVPLATGTESIHERQRRALRLAQEKLGSPAQRERVEAIRELDALASDAPHLHRDIAESLAAFIRDQVPWVGATEYPKPLIDRAYDVHEAILLLTHEVLVPDDTRINLRSVDLRSLELPPGARMNGFDLSGSHLHNETSKMKDAQLRGAILEHAQLDRAQMEGADFTGAFASSVILKRTIVRNGHFDRTDLTGACLIGTDFTGATGLTTAKLTGALANKETIWPDGFEPRQHGVNLDADDCTP